GLSLEDVASRLKKPVRVVKSLEQEDWSHVGAPVFVRGQLRSYAKLLGLPIDPVVEAAGVAPVEPPKLAPRTYISPLQRFAEQAARRTIYIVMTAAIAIPVWLTAQSHLDVASVAQDAAPLDVPVAPGATDPAPDGPALVDEGPRPVVASLASLPARKAPATATRPGLSLRLSGDSWSRSWSMRATSATTTRARSARWCSATRASWTCACRAAAPTCRRSCARMSRALRYPLTAHWHLPPTEDGVGADPSPTGRDMRRA